MVSNSREKGYSRMINTHHKQTKVQKNAKFESKTKIDKILIKNDPGLKNFISNLDVKCNNDKCSTKNETQADFLKTTDLSNKMIMNVDKFPLAHPDLNINKRFIFLNKTQDEFKIMRKDLLLKELIISRLSGNKTKESRGKYINTDFIDYKHKKDLIDIYPRLHEAAKSIFHSIKTKNKRIYDNYKIYFEIKFPKFLPFLDVFDVTYNNYSNCSENSLDLQRIYFDIKTVILEINKEKNLGFEFKKEKKIENSENNELKVVTKFGNMLRKDLAGFNNKEIERKVFNQTPTLYINRNMKESNSDGRLFCVSKKKFGQKIQNMNLLCNLSSRNLGVLKKNNGQLYKMSGSNAFQEVTYHKNFIEFIPLIKK